MTSRAASLEQTMADAAGQFAVDEPGISPAAIVRALPTELNGRSRDQMHTSRSLLALLPVLGLKGSMQNSCGVTLRVLRVVPIGTGKLGISP